MIRLKRVYEPASGDDGYRVLVERLWPRGVTKSRAALDAWCRDLAPMPELRVWFGHDPSRWEEFLARYWEELAEKQELMDALARKSAGGVVTFVYSSHDPDHNNAVALKMMIEGKEVSPVGGERPRTGRSRGVRQQGRRHTRTQVSFQEVVR
ncbi:MAG: DUF488 family protein [Methanomicrobiales archaeon]|nr:DUF488 family protein [Methanomicrobiales archaeon]